MLAIIKPGLLMTWKEEYIPEELKHWDKIILTTLDLVRVGVNEIRIQHFYKDKVEKWLSHWIGYVDETVFDLNVVSIDENTVITNGYDARIEKELKQYGVEIATSILISDINISGIVDYIA